jgi:hypothetical protein
MRPAGWLSEVLLFAPNVFQQDGESALTNGSTQTEHGKLGAHLERRFTGTRLSRAALTRIKEVAVFDRPFVQRAAFVGPGNLPNVLYEALKTFSRREFPRFKTRKEAMDWLVREEA